MYKISYNILLYDEYINGINIFLEKYIPFTKYIYAPIYLSIRVSVCIFNIYVCYVKYNIKIYKFS